MVLGCWLLLALVACAPALPVAVVSTPTPAVALVVRVVAEGASRDVTTSAATVAEALDAAGVAIGPADIVEPPLDEPLLPGTTPTITIVRVSETTEVIPEAIPFGRQIVRSAEMSPDDPPRLLQTGQPGLQEVTVRIVFHDGLEAERWPTATTVIEPARDEIIMIGVTAARDRMTFDGALAYIDDGRAVLLDGATDAPRQLAVDGTLDGRVFQLSPEGDYLLYTLAEPAAGQTFRNSLWVVATVPEAEPRALAIENVLWAGWDPSAIPPRIAYTTARSISLPPGWEANNDVWLLELPDDSQPAPVRLIESLPAAYAWWGGNFAWSPDGRLAYAFADQVGLIAVPRSLAGLGPAGQPSAPEPATTTLHTFTPLDTGADWAWVPSLGWSADSRYLTFGDHAAPGESDAPATDRFDLRLADMTTDSQIVLAEAAGMWAASQWSPAASLPEYEIAFLQAIEPEVGADSGYALWLAGSDGRDARRIYPPEGETSLFAPAALVWGPDPDRLAFIFDDELHILDLPAGEVYQTGPDDTLSSHPTWAPYGTAVTPAAP